MKKVFFAFALLATVFSASAQQRNQFYLQTGSHSSNFQQASQAPSRNGEHVANLLIGGLTGDLDLFLTTPPTATRVQTTSVSNFTVGYRRTVGSSQRVQMGFSGSVHRYRNTIEWSEGPITRTSERFLTGMVDAQVSWWKNPYLNVYSGVGAGLTIHQRSGDHVSSNLLLNGQFNAFGVQAHDGPVGAFVQVGVGAQGRVSGGLVARF